MIQKSTTSDSLPVIALITTSCPPPFFFFVGVLQKKKSKKKNKCALLNGCFMRLRTVCETLPPPLTKHNKRSRCLSTREPGPLSDRRKGRLPSLCSAARLGGTVHQRASALFENSVRYFQTYTFPNALGERRWTHKGGSGRSRGHVHVKHHRRIYPNPAVHSYKRHMCV